MALTFKIDQVGLPAGADGEARTDGLAADVGGGLAAKVSVTTSGAPIGSTVVVELLDTPQLPTPDATATASLAEDPIGSGIWTFNPEANRYGKFRIRATATLVDGTEQTLTRTLAFLSPLGLMEVPALNERGDRSASLVNQGADVLANTESNSGPEGFRAWHRWMLRISKLVEDLVGGGGGGGGGLTPGLFQTGSSDYVAAVGELVILAVLGSTKIIKAPPTPANGDRWGVLTGGDVGLSDVILDGNGRPLAWGAATSLARPFRGSGIRASFVYVAQNDQWQYEPGNLDEHLVGLLTTSAPVEILDASGPVDLFVFHAFGTGFNVGAIAGATYEVEVVFQINDPDLGSPPPAVYQVARAQFSSQGGALAEDFVNFVVSERNGGLGTEVTGSLNLVGPTIVFRAAGRSVGAGRVVANARARVLSNVLFDVSGAPA